MSSLYFGPGYYEKFTAPREKWMGSIRQNDKIKWQYDDGGRSGFTDRKDKGACVTRAIVIASGLPYSQVHEIVTSVCEEFNVRNSKKIVAGRRYKSGVNRGVDRKLTKKLMKYFGFKWVPLMGIGTGCKVHVRTSELPTTGRLILNLSHHVAAYIDGVLRDTYDCSRNGKRCVYGYWHKPS